MKIQKIAFVLRDIMPTRMAVPLIKWLKSIGHEIYLFPEGKAIDLCREEGLGEDFTTVGHEEIVPIPQSAAEKRVADCSVVCVGCSSPINWELAFAKEAHRKGIPVVALCDIWGSIERLGGFIPDLALVIDGFEKEKVLRDGLAKEAMIAGDIASKTKTKKLILLVGDHTNNALEIVATVAGSIRKSENPEQFTVVPRLVHPKLAGNPEVKKILGRAEKLLEGISVNKMEGVDTDTLASICHLTVSSFSTPLRIALHHGRRAVSINGPASRKLMLRETGLETFPLVTRHLMDELLGNEPLSSFITINTGNQWAGEARFRTEDIALEILKLAEGGK